MNAQQVTEPAVKVLIIDDEADVRGTLAACLEDADYDVLQAADGPSGLQMCRHLQPDVVLCDLRMPGMDGLTVMDMVHAEMPEMPFIVLSGVGRVSDAVEALKRGAWDYLSKPLEDVAVLEHALGQALERSQLMRRNREYQEHLETTNRRLQESLQQLEDDEAAGRRIQWQLLPEDDLVVGGVRFRRRLLTSMYLSGDFVDYFPIDDTHLGFYIADVSGHGVSSAFVTVLLKSYMSRYLELFHRSKSKGLLDPAKILHRLNRNILKSNMGKYLTMFYGVLNTKTLELTYAVGGQYPPPVLVDGEEVRFIADRNVPVGLFDFAEYHNEHLSLPPHFCLTLMSDGILELLPGSMESRLSALAAAARTAPRDLDGVLAHLGVNPEATLPDDITVLLIDRVEATA